MSIFAFPILNEFGFPVSKQVDSYFSNGILCEIFDLNNQKFNEMFFPYSDSSESYPNECVFITEKNACNDSNGHDSNGNESSDPEESSRHEELLSVSTEPVIEDDVLSQESKSLPTKISVKKNVLSQESESLPTEISVEDAVFAAITEQDGLSSQVESLILSFSKDEFILLAMIIRTLALVCDKSQTNNSLGYEKLSFKNHKLFTSVLWEPILNNSKVISTDIKDETLFNLVKSLLVRIWGDKAPVNLVHFVSNKPRKNHGKLYPKKK